ncbi:FtsX-like permease family protein [Thalassotalea ganghwensis]
MSTLIDIKYALRLLLKSPRFTAMTLGVLIGGLSISLFTFSFLYTTVYKPLPLPEGDSAKAVAIYHNDKYRNITGYEFHHVKDNIQHFEEFGIYGTISIRLSVGQAGRDYSASLVRDGLFKFSRTQPLYGRTIEASDTLPDAAPVALISFEIWQEQFQGDTNLSGKTLRLNGEVTDIIGVMPQGYRFPSTAQIWLPLRDSIFNKPANLSNQFFAYARLKDGASIEQAEQELGQAVNQLYQQHVKLYDLPELVKTAKILTFPMAQTGNEGGIVFAFLNGIAGLILLLACINVGNLLLARTLQRQKETAIRAAIGATTQRLVSHLMWEGIIISVLGGVLAVLLVGGALEYFNILFHSWVPNGGSFWWQYGMDGATLLMGVVFTLVTIALSSFLPAWRSAHQDVNATLRDGTRGAQGKKAGRMSKILVTTQIFLVATLMMIGAVSAYISHKLINIDLGDDYSNVITARFGVPDDKYVTKAEQLNVYLSLKDKIAAHPQVSGVIASSWIGKSTLTIDGHDFSREEDKPSVDTITVIGSTETYGVNLIAGRQFEQRDDINARKTAIISQSMANRYWPGESPLEKSFIINIGDEEVRVYVIGVVSNRLNSSTLFGKLDSADEVYLSGLQFSSNYFILYYRIEPNTANPEEIFYQAMYDTDRNIELTYSVQPADRNRSMMRDSMKLMSKVTFVTGFFALLLAMVGIYGLTANAVAQKTHEVGIRRAVGASDSAIIKMFLKQGARQLVIGLGLATAFFALISFGFHQFTERLFPVSMYFGVVITVIVGLSTIVMLAILAPTKTAVKMEPSAALRYE